MNVPTQHSIDMIALGVFHHRRFELANETHRVFVAPFHISAERPITTPEAPANEIDQRIKLEQKLVTDDADKGEPLHVLHNSVEFVSVNDENASAVRRPMNGVFLDGDVSVGAIK